MVVAPHDIVLGVVGDDLTLPCYLKNNENAEDLDVQWIVNGMLVHRYKDHTDQTADQLSVYQGRTSLFQDELQRGNISLKLLSVRLEDTNTYTCYVGTLLGTFDASFKVKIDGRWMGFQGKALRQIYSHVCIGILNLPLCKQEKGAP